MANTTDANQQVKAIIEKAMADLMAVGATQPDACAILAIQALCALPEDELDALKAIKDFADDSWAAFSTGAGETIQ
ncbi:MAG: hypothetical protein MEQ84_08470 [Mesorhizobium sp.]|nr:hypothetical protein [Mesorhizobium sp.]